MLQILSTSNETSTGTELVQNGNFSELGSDLVTNGNFSAAGSNLVSNPNFTDTGSEMNIADGSSPQPNHFRFVDYGTNIVAYDGSGVTTITYVDDDRGALHYFKDSYNLNTPTLTIGKSYKIEITCKINSGTYGIQLNSNIGNYNVSGLSNTDFVTHIIYAYTKSLSGNWIRIDNLEAGQVASINDVSIKELGEGWTVEMSDGSPTTSLKYVEFVETGARFVSDVTAVPYLYLEQSTLSSGKLYKFTCNVAYTDTGGIKVYVGGEYTDLDEGLNTIYSSLPTTATTLRFLRNANDVDCIISNVSVQELGEDWTLGTGWSIGEDVAISDGSAGSITQSILSADVFYKIRIKVTGNPTLLVFSSTSFYGDEAARTLKNGTHNYYLQAKVADFSITNEGGDACTITNISTEQLDPNDYWTLGTGWSIGADKAISTVTGSNSDITQSILTAGKTYRTVYEIVDYDAGTSQAIVTGSDGADAVALGTYTEDLTTTGTDFSIRSKLGTFDGAVSSVSVKQLGTYEDQSIYVTAADVQTIPQASVYYLVELTSMGSKNSLYFIPSSIVPNNGRYTKLNFTVISKDALPQPTVGIISFYDSVGGLDTYPMGFYEFRIYEQTSSTNLDPLLATGLLEKGFAFVRDFSGNMQELTDGFKEYNPALTQYVYSK